MNNSITANFFRRDLTHCDDRTWVRLKTSISCLCRVGVDNDIIIEENGKRLIADVLLRL